MDFKIACEILEIDITKNINNINVEFLKKRYHKLALQHHPDKKGNTTHSKEKFQQINEAYTYLSREIRILNNQNNQSSPNNLYSEDTTDTNTAYVNILNLFLDNLLKSKYTDFFMSIIKDIVIGCKEITIKLFENVDKERILAMYNFLFKYKNILYINDDILEKVREIILEKYKDVQIYILNPSINDMFDNNVYKLELNKVIYFVPLWHNELYFDNKCCDKSCCDKPSCDKSCCDKSGDNLIVKCIPELPENVSIDEDNNIFVNLYIQFRYSLLQQKTYSFYLGEKKFDIPIEKLYMTQKQYYVIKGCGISKIDENDIYNVEEKGDIILKIVFCE